MDNIVLIGFMGSGKTSVGRELAKNLSYQFLDTDKVIEEQEKRSIRSIFSGEGEAYFRLLENKLIKKYMGNLSSCVLSVGGGLPVCHDNAELLRQLGKVVYLKTSKETIKIRLSGDSQRPLLSGDNTDFKMEKLMEQRAPIYEKTAHVTIITDHKTIEELVKEIIVKTGDTA